MLRVKNEARWITEVLESLKQIASEVFVFDDHSTDDTPALAEAAGATVFPSTFEGVDEARDKDALLDAVRAFADPDWVIAIDGDEVLMPGSAEVIRTWMDDGAKPSLAFQVCYLWDRPDQWRTDGIYSRFFRASAFNNRETNGRFARTGFGGNFHCSNVPHDVLRYQYKIPVRLKHYGYIDRAQRLAKFDWYNSIDPGNLKEDCYRHMVLGDRDDLPAETECKHAGPLILRPWS